MADLARLARPLLSPLAGKPLRPAALALTHIGLGAHRGPGHRWLRTVQQRKERQSRAKERASDKMGTGSTYLCPYTIVPPPIWRFPRSPPQFASMVWLLVRNRWMIAKSLLGLYLENMRTANKWWPTFRPGRRQSIPTAKALHAQMSQAVAAADKETLRRICAPEFFMALAGPADSRPRGTRTEWELVRYLRAPRIADFRVMYLHPPSGKGLYLVRQSVVSIASVQKLTRYDAEGKKVPGTGAERHMTEHIVLQSRVDSNTFECDPWKLWGTLPEMTYEEIRVDMALLDEAQQTG